MLPSGRGAARWNPEEEAREDVREETADRGPAAPRSEVSGPSLFGFSGSDLRAVGGVLLIFGIVLFLAGALHMMSGVTVPQASMDPTAWFQESTAHAMTGFALSSVGLVLIGIRTRAFRFGLIRPVTSFVAGEAPPAIETASTAIGRGLEEARVQLPPAAPTAAVQTVVKVKCKNCG